MKSLQLPLPTRPLKKCVTGLKKHFGGKNVLRGITIGTFHSVCLKQLGSPTLISRSEALEASEKILNEVGLKETPSRFLQLISGYKNGVIAPNEEVLCAIQKYQALLQSWDVLT